MPPSIQSMRFSFNNSLKFVRVPYDIDADFQNLSIGAETRDERTVQGAMPKLRM